MFKKTVLVAGIALAVSATAHADYRWEANAAVARTNIDLGPDDGDVDSFGLGGSFYLESVDTEKGPLSEAAFLDHASNVSVGYIYTDLDDIVEDVDGDEYGISGRYVLDLDRIPLIFEGSYSRATPDFSDIDTYSVGFGAYLTDTTTLIATFGNIDVDEGGDADFYEISVRHLWSLTSGAIVLEGNYGAVDVDNADDVDVYNAAATWYVNNTLGFGGRFGRFDNFGLEADEFGIFSEWFITEGIAVSAEYSYSEIDDTDVEIESFGIGAKMRF